MYIYDCIWSQMKENAQQTLYEQQDDVSVV